MRRLRLGLIPVVLILPLTLAACGGGSSAKAGVTPTATASIEIIGTPAASSGSTVTGSQTGVASSGLTVSTQRQSSATTSAATVATSVATGAAYTVSGTGNVGLRLRQAPNGAKITDLPAGTVVTAIGDAPQQAGGYTWIHIKTAKGASGWVATQYLAGGAVAGTPTAPAGGQ